ncbi:unnamed protein product, partial [Ectocarpus sp. 8 AP-2014]
LAPNAHPCSFIQVSSVSEPSRGRILLRVISGILLISQGKDFTSPGAHSMPGSFVLGEPIFYRFRPGGRTQRLAPSYNSSCQSSPTVSRHRRAVIVERLFNSPPPTTPPPSVFAI